MKTRVLLPKVLAALTITMASVPGYTADVCVAITAKVTAIEDQGNFLNGRVGIGSVITGQYIYDSLTPDTNPLLTVGDYQHTAAPYGITLNVGSLTFRTDPSKVDFLVELVNNHGNPQSEAYLLRSYNNTFDISVPSI